MMKLHEVLSIQGEPDGALIVTIVAENEGVMGQFPYVLRFDDPYGLAPAIRAAIGWTDRDNPPHLG